MMKTPTSPRWLLHGATALVALAPALAAAAGPAAPAAGGSAPAAPAPAEGSPPVAPAPAPDGVETGAAGAGATSATDAPAPAGTTPPTPSVVDAPAPAATPPDAPDTTADPKAAAWRLQYRGARESLRAGRYAEAARVLDAIADGAPTADERLLAHELAVVARERLEQEEEESEDRPDIRTSDEISVLYATSFLYGLGTSAWVTLQVRPKTVAGAMLPFALLTTATVGGVSVADRYQPFRRGVPQSISAGLYLGFGEGVWMVGYQQAVAHRRTDIPRWRAETVSTVLWSASTAFGIGGGVLGALRQPTPGRVSYTSSTTVWGGLIGGFGASALQRDSARRGETAMLSAGVGYNLGLVAGLLTSPLVAPSVARVRFVDLGGIGGGLLGAGAYALIDENARTPALLGAAAAGSVVGLAASWWATRNMPKDLGPDGQTSLQLHPTLSPVKGGVVAGVSGML